VLDGFPAWMQILGLAEFAFGLNAFLVVFSGTAQFMQDHRVVPGIPSFFVVVRKPHI
jgi:hypothetical protein